MIKTEYKPTKIFAAGLSTPIAFKIVAPSFVTCISFLSEPCNILSYNSKILLFTKNRFLLKILTTIPFGPKVDFIKSPIAIAPTNADYLKNINKF